MTDGLEIKPHASLPVIPDHELVHLIGKGSYGEVWLARNTLGTYRAVKIVYEKSFRHKRPFDREFSGVQKFEPVSRLHENLMDILQVGRNDAAGYFYCIMELADDVVSGQLIDPEKYSPRTLARDMGEQKRLAVEQCLQVGVAIASALEFLHDRGLVHRDVKPSNIVFVNGVPKLADIGLVAEMSEARSYVGTEGFIPPEGPGTVQADIYSLGKVLYEISTGNDRHDYPQPATELCDAAPGSRLPGLNTIVLQACRTDPRNRYKCAAEILRDMRALANDAGDATGRSRRRSAAQGLAITAACLGVFGAPVLFLANINPPPPTGAPAATPVGVVGWWRGEHSTRSEKNELDGVITGTGRVTYGPGVVGEAFVFDGVDRDRVDLGNPTNLQLQNFTIEAWIRRLSAKEVSFDDDGADGTMVGQGAVIFGYGMAGYAFAIDNAGTLMLTKMAIDNVFSKHRIADTNWHHVAVVKAGMKVVFAIDGVVEAPRDYDHPSDYAFKSSVAIGANGDGGGNTFFGMIDEIAIYNGALSAPQLQAIYDAGSTGKQPALCTPVPSDLISWWMGEADAGDTVGGRSAEAHGTLKFAPGAVGTALSFDGSECWIEVADDASLNPTNAITIECWLNRRTLVGPYDPVIKKTGRPAHPSFGGFSLAFQGNDITFWIHGEAWTGSSKASLAFNTWYHVAGVYDGTNVCCYVNGRLVGVPQRVSGRMEASTGSLFIGKDTSPPNGFFDGLLDEICIYNRALSASELEAIYHAGSGGKCLPTGRYTRR